MRLVRGLFVFLLLAVCASAKLAVPGAHAAEAPVTVTFTEVGAHTFTVPTGITMIHVVAVGAPGSDQGLLSGGAGAVATADLAVTPGQALTANVGGPGTETVGAISFGGGGPAGLHSGGGGGASDIRNGEAGDLSTRLVVAGGGGGAGSQSVGGAAGQPGGTLANRCEGGAAGSATAGGAGGQGFTGGDEADTERGGAGSLGQGGAGSADPYDYGSGGGGGGLYGGGAGGASGQETAGISRCGGGGGSSGFGPGTSATSVDFSNSSTPSVTISYVVSSPPDSGVTTTNPSTSSTPTTSTGPSGDTGSGSSKATVSLPAVQRGNQVVGTVRIPADRSALKVKLVWRKGNGSTGRRDLAAEQTVVGSLTEAPLKKGLHSFTVKLNKRGKASLANLGKLKLTLEVRITPPQGAVAVGAKKLTLKP